MAHPAIVPDQFPWLDTTRYSFSPGIAAAGAAWLAGQTGGVYDAEADRITVPADPREQARIAWDKIGAVLGDTIPGLGACSEVVEYLSVDGLAERGVIAAMRPAVVEHGVSTIVVASLLRPGAVVEVEVVAGAAPGTVRLPQIGPFDAGGSVVAPGDLVGQCEFVLERAVDALAEHGLGAEHVVRTLQQTTPATRGDYRATADARRRLLGPAFPASTGVLVPTLPHPDALVALDVWASAEPKTVVNPGWSAYDELTFSPAVRAGQVLYVSGTTACDPDTGATVAEGDVAAQAEFVYECIGEVCRAAGGSIDDLVKTIEYVTPAAVESYRAVAAVRKRLLGRPLPASTGVVVEALLSRNWLIEVEAVAVIDS